ncbi:TetR/AcrR family transcriptional regulator [Rathayibacter sp. YIM 133350]|uniref:TetR/AcrR family transcriptional regulator n=1 Tax=Rathayibacter sp. YIM 133350 TaxID=3131992 RepID=UPI00307F585F
MGRARMFEEEDLLERATDLFWSRGFEATSVADISQASGVANGSLYAAYGSKLNLFLIVFERYCRARVALVESTMAASTDSIEQAVRAFFAVIIADCASHQPSWGCLMLNSVAEIGARHPDVLSISSRAVSDMETAIERRLEQAADAGEAPSASTDRAVLAAQIVLISQGLIQLSRMNDSPERLEEIAAASTRMLPLGRGTQA